MRRQTVCAAVALLTFVAGCLASGRGLYHLAFAFPAAGAALLLRKLSAVLPFDLHHFKVAVLTLALWAATAYLNFALFMPTVGNCLVELPPEESGAYVTRQDAAGATAAPDTRPAPPPFSPCTAGRRSWRARWSGPRRRAS